MGRAAVLALVAVVAVAVDRWWTATRPVQATWQGWPTSFHVIGRSS